MGKTKQPFSSPLKKCSLPSKKAKLNQCQVTIVARKIENGNIMYYVCFEADEIENKWYTISNLTKYKITEKTLHKFHLNIHNEEFRLKLNHIIEHFNSKLHPRSQLRLPLYIIDFNEYLNDIVNNLNKTSLNIIKLQIYLKKNIKTKDKSDIIIKQECKKLINCWFYELNTQVLNNVTKDILYKILSLKSDSETLISKLKSKSPDTTDSKIDLIIYLYKQYVTYNKLYYLRYYKCKSLMELGEDIMKIIYWIEF